MTKAQEVMGALVDYREWDPCPACCGHVPGKRFIANRFEWYCSCGWAQLVHPE